LPVINEPEAAAKEANIAALPKISLVRWSTHQRSNMLFSYLQTSLQRLLHAHSSPVRGSNERFGPEIFVDSAVQPRSLDLDHWISQDVM
jgi:hypothetical protein